MTAITLDGVNKVYPDGTSAVKDLSLEIADGELMIFVGPSGCGKTTTLRMVAGLEGITSGQVRIGDKVVNNLEPRQRDIAMVFQNYALYPHMSVYDNIGFPLAAQKFPKKLIDERVRRTAQLLGLENLKQRPAALSGGQRQRVAMGRAIVREPQAFLMDEPLSNLDAKLRVQMRGEIRALQEKLGVTTVYVTHDQVEAMTMGDRIAIMRHGRLEQVGTPKELYDRPVNLFVATFVGSPGMSLLQGRIEADAGGISIDLGEQSIRLRPPNVAAVASYAGRAVALGLRAEHVALASEENRAWPRLKGVVSLVEMLGHESLIHVRTTADPVVSEDVVDSAKDVDAAVVQTLRSDARQHAVNVIVRASSDVKANVGSSVEIAVRPDCVHLFDLESGQAVA